MTRKPSTTWDTKPHKPIFYGPLARLADRFAGDGNAAIPDVPAGPANTADPQAATTPYQETRRRHFLDRSERETPPHAGYYGNFRIQTRRTIMRQLRHRALVRAATATAAMVPIFALSLAASSSPAEASTGPNAIQIYCNVGYGLSDANVPDGSPVQYYTDGYSGTTYQNNWKCDYLAVYSIPMPDFDTAPGEMNLGLEYTMPPIHESVGINFRRLCSLIWPGSNLAWVPGPETGIDGAPWTCNY